jgi:hypothetical protein
MASLGRAVALEVAGAGRVVGTLQHVGSGWCLVGEAGRDWLVPTAAIEVAEGLSDRAVPEIAWSPVARLALGSALRRLADDGTACLVITRTGAQYAGALSRIGRDFVELTLGEPSRRLVLALDAVGAVQSCDLL